MNDADGDGNKYGKKISNYDIRVHASVWLLFIIIYLRVGIKYIRICLEKFTLKISKRNLKLTV